VIGVTVLAARTKQSYHRADASRTIGGRLACASEGLILQVHPVERGLKMTGQAVSAPPRISTEAMPRRELLRYLLAGTSIASLGGCCTMPAAIPPPDYGRFTAVDAHCHVFNALDVPIPGGVQHVLLHDMPVVAELAYVVLSIVIHMLRVAGITTAADEASKIRCGDSLFRGFTRPTAESARENARRPLRKAYLACSAIRRPGTAFLSSTVVALRRKPAVILRNSAAIWPHCSTVLRLVRRVAVCASGQY
jgi:hypothetical protein